MIETDLREEHPEQHRRTDVGLRKQEATLEYVEYAVDELSNGGVLAGAVGAWHKAAMTR